MFSKRFFRLVMALTMILSGVVLAGASTAFTYQGQLQQANANFSGTANLAFRLYDVPTGGDMIGSENEFINHTISDGLFKVTLDFGAGAFTEEPRWLEVRVNGAPLVPRQAITPAPMAIRSLTSEGLSGHPVADNPPEFAQVLRWQGSAWAPDDDVLTELSCADGQIIRFGAGQWQCSEDENTEYTAGTGLALVDQEFSVQGSALPNLIVVAPSGGDFTSIQAAMDSITDASESNRYLVWVGPGFYQERVTVRPWVIVQGAGRELTVIHWTGDDDIAEAATVTLESNSVLRDVRVESISNGHDWTIGAAATEDSGLLIERIFVIADGGQISSSALSWTSSAAANNYIRDSRFEALGSGSSNTALEGQSVWIRLDQVETFAFGGASNRGMLFGNCSEIRVVRSRIEGGIHSSDDFSCQNVRIAHSEISGSITGDSYSCLGNYNPSFSSISCP